jgi:hypothetical protein
MAGSEGIDRRTLIKSAAIAGAAAWTAPVIVDSLASPAAAASGGGLFDCSYATVVFTVNSDPSNTPYAVKFTGSTCSNDNGTSGGGPNQFSVNCPGVGTFSNTCSGDTVCKDGTPVAANTGPCPISGDGSTFTANAGITIIWVGVHDGVCSPGHTCSFCGPATKFTVGKNTKCQPQTQP